MNPPVEEQDLRFFVQSATIIGALLAAPVSIEAPVSRAFIYLIPTVIAALQVANMVLTFDGECVNLYWVLIRSDLGVVLEDSSAELHEKPRRFSMPPTSQVYALTARSIEYFYSNDRLHLPHHSRDQVVPFTSAHPSAPPQYRTLVRATSPTAAGRHAAGGAATSSSGTEAQPAEATARWNPNMYRTLDADGRPYNLSDKNGNVRLESALPFIRLVAEERKVSLFGHDGTSYVPAKVHEFLAIKGREFRRQGDLAGASDPVWKSTGLHFVVKDFPALTDMDKFAALLSGLWSQAAPFKLAYFRPPGQPDPSTSLQDINIALQGFELVMRYVFGDAFMGACRKVTEMVLSGRYSRRKPAYACSDIEEGISGFFQQLTQRVVLSPLGNKVNMLEQLSVAVFLQMTLDHLNPTADGQADFFASRKAVTASQPPAQKPAGTTAARGPRSQGPRGAYLVSPPPAPAPAPRTVPGGLEFCLRSVAHGLLPALVPKPCIFPGCTRVHFVVGTHTGQQLRAWLPSRAASLTKYAHVQALTTAVNSY
jgi:hypothetical protein